MREAGRVDWEQVGPAELTLGVGATPAERRLVYGAAALAALAWGLLGLLGYRGWAWWQILLVAVLAADVAGGVVANATSSCKRFYHSPARPEDPPAARWLRRGHTFALLHLHTLALGLLIPGASPTAGAAWYAALILSVLAVRRAPLYLRRPVAFALIAAAIVAHQYALPLGPGLEWLVPLLWLKIVYGHSVQEEPYRP